MNHMRASFSDLIRKYRMWRSVEWKLDWLIRKAKHGEYRITKKQNEKHYAEQVFKRQLYYYTNFSDPRHHFAVHEFEQLIDRLFEDGILEEHYFGMSYALTMKGKSFIGYRKTKFRETVKSLVNASQIALAASVSLLVILHTGTQIWVEIQKHKEEITQKQLQKLEQKIDTLLLKFESSNQ